MRTSTYFSGLAVISWMLASAPSSAQIVSNNVFLQGNYIEVGSAPNGSFGSNVNAPTGYHPRTGGTLQLGFVADVAKDGWSIGTPDYHGDFFLPGTPQEGWSVSSGTVEGKAWRSSTLGTYGGFVGPLTGSNISYNNTPTEITAVWQGMYSTNLQVTQLTRVKKDKLYFTVSVTLKNTGTTTVPDVYYMRTLDPDNDEVLTLDFATKNKIEYALPNSGNKVLVRAIDKIYAQCYLGLGTMDCRAKPFIFKSDLFPSHNIKQMYDAAPASTYYTTQGSTFTGDVGIAIVYKIGDIAPGDSALLTYAYILNEADMEEALASTAATLSVDNTITIPGDTVNVAAGCGVCDTVTLGVNGAPGTVWNWYPTSVMLDTVGDSVQAVICGPTEIYAVGAGICGTDTLSLSFNPAGVIIPPPTVTSPITYCQGDLAGPLTAVGWPLQWWTAPTGGVPLSAAPVPNTSIPGTYTWYVSTYSGTCQSERVPIEVIVNPKPATPLLTASPVPLCSGNTLTLTATSSLSGVSWDISGPGGFTSNTDVSTIPAVTTLNTGVYSAIATLNGCTSLPGTVNVTVNQTPVMPTVTYNQPLCDSSTLELHAVTDVSPVTYIWSGPNGFVSSVGNPVIPMAVLGLNDGVYVVTPYAAGGCVGEAGSVNVVINPIPAPPHTDSIIYCQFTSAVPLTANGSNLTWYTAATGKDTFLSAPIPQTDTAGVTIYYVSQTQLTCESQRAPLVVTIDPKPVASITADQDSICAGSKVHLNLEINTPAASMNWDFGDGTTLSGMESVYHSYESEGTYLATLTLGFNVCPDTMVKTLVTVLPVPRIDLGRDTAMCPGAGPLALMDYMNAGDGGATWLWNTGATTNSIIVTQPGIYWSTVSLGGCAATDSVEVRKDCYLDMPNIFTPNGDGLNDYFFPRQELTSSMAAFKMTIFNRWGEKVFETSSINGRGWDGKFNGKDQPQGVYIYQVQAVFLNGRSENLTGNVTLIR